MIFNLLGFEEYRYENCTYCLLNVCSCLKKNCIANVHVMNMCLVSVS